MKKSFITWGPDFSEKSHQKIGEVGDQTWDLCVVQCVIHYNITIVLFQ